jgi:4-carboxymuconolactone decarboxylase
MARIEPLPQDKMDPEFARYYEDLVRSGGRTGGPGIAIMRNPQFFKLHQAMGDAIRANSLTPSEREIAILTAARAFSAPFAWRTHARLALAAGVSRDTIDAINERRRPQLAQAGELAAWEVAESLATKRAIDDAAYSRALAALGEQRLVDLVVTVGFYSMIGTTLRAFEIDSPADDPIPLKS